MKKTTKKLAAYTAAGTALLAATQDADAQLVFNSGNVAPGTMLFDTGVGLDLDGDGNADVNLTHDNDGGFYGPSFAVAFASAPAGNALFGYSYLGYLYASNFATSANISAGVGQALSFGYMADGSGFVNSQFAPAPNQGFLGIEFQSGGNTHYGFVEILIGDDPHTSGNGSPDNKITLGDYAFNLTPGAPAHVENVPEPTSLGLLAAGALGLGALRRRRKEEN